MDQERDPGQLGQPVSETPDEAARIREQIEHTRAHLSGTIEELQDRLRPEHLVSQAGEAVRATVEQKVRTMVNTASDTARNVADQARNSAVSLTDELQRRPIPTALALGGVAWWLMRGRRDDYPPYGSGDAMRGVMPAVAIGALGYYLLSQRMVRQGYTSRGSFIGDGFSEAPDGLGAGDYGEYGVTDSAPGAGLGDRVRELGESAGERVRQLGETAEQYRHRAQAAVGEYASQVGGYASQVGNQARHYTDVARVRVGETTNMLLERSEDLAENFDRWMQENPLTVGVAAFALGAIAGLSVPASEAEHRTLGPARERLMQQAGKVVDTALAR